MSNTMIDFNYKFKTKELLISETKYWIWSLRPIQPTLGSSILSLKRECSTLNELNQDEFTDLNNIIKVIERTLKKTFSYDVINYLMLMMVDNHVHYHVIPRYEKPIYFKGISWEDTDWPAIPNLSGNETELKTLKTIQSVIKENLIV